MKTKLLLAFLCFFILKVQAQRIDYALNHQEGGTFIQPNLLKVINDNLLLVSYSLTNNGIERKNMISIMDSEGRLLKSTTVNYVYEGDVIAIDILSNGYVAYLKRAFNKTCAIKARFYDVNLYLIKEISLYQGDSVNDVRFDCNNKKNATLVNGVTLRVGSINEVTRTVEMVNVVLDSLPVRLKPTLRWMTDFKSPTLYLWYANQAQLISFDDSLNISKIDSIPSVSNPIFFNQKFYSSYVGYNNQDDYYFHALIDSAGYEVNRVFVSKNPLLDNHELIADNNYLFMFTSIGRDPNSQISADSSVLTWVTRDLVMIRQLHLQSTKVVSAGSDKIKHLFVMGWNGSETVIYKFNDGTICIGLSEMDKDINIPTLYPNPTTHQISFSQVINNGWVQLINTQGQVVLSATQAQNIDVSHLPSGLYFYQLTNVQQQVVAHGKIIKQ